MNEQRLLELIAEEAPEHTLVFATRVNESQAKQTNDFTGWSNHPSASSQDPAEVTARFVTASWFGDQVRLDLVADEEIPVVLYINRSSLDAMAIGLKVNGEAAQDDIEGEIAAQLWVLVRESCIRFYPQEADGRTIL
jgi:hypothetical protein